jgi:hypothetical protein
MIADRVSRRVLDGLPAYPLLVLFGLNAVDELDRAAFGILLPEIREAFDLDLTGVLTLVTVTGVVGLLLQVPIGLIVDRTRRMAGGARWCRRVGRRVAGHGPRADDRGARHLPHHVRTRQGDHRSDAQLADRRLLPTRGPRPRLLVPPGGQRRWARSSARCWPD